MSGERIVPGVRRERQPPTLGSGGSIYRVCKNAARKAGLSKGVSAHTLPTASPLICWRRADLKTIQVLLGHSCLNSTSVYVHVAAQVPGCNRRAEDLLALAMRKGARR